jgi:hypothetical protein
MSNNKIKDTLLGQPHGTAQAKLRKALLFEYVTKAGDDFCYRCGGQIEDIRDFSIEHKNSWQRATDPKAAFFNLCDIAFSHLSCNVRAGEKRNGRADQTHCKYGHPFNEENTRLTSSGKRRCRECRMVRKRQGLSWG